MAKLIRVGLVLVLAALGVKAAIAEEAYVRQTSGASTGDVAAAATTRNLVATPVDLGVAKAAVTSTGFQPSNIAQVYQLGAYNNATVAQSGGGNIATLVQQGHGNTALISQTNRAR